MKDFLNLIGGLLVLSANLVIIIFFGIIIIKSAVWMWTAIF